MVLNNFIGLSSRFSMALDLVAVFLFYWVGILYSPYANIIELDFKYYLLMAGHSVIVVAFGLGAGFYDLSNISRFFVRTFLNFSAHITALLISVALVYFGYYSQIGRLAPIYGAMCSFAGLTLLKFGGFVWRRRFPVRFSVLGGKDYVPHIKDTFSGKSSGLKMLDSFPSIDGSIDGFLDGCKNKGVRLVVVSLPEIETSKFIELQIAARKKGVLILEFVDFYSKALERVPLGLVDERWVIEKGLFNQSRIQVILKRLVDIAISSFMLLGSLPFMLIVALGIKISSKGPIFFKQMRMGEFLEKFEMFKLRTMHITNEARKDGEVFTGKNDSRVFALGRLIRPLHIDELPQLLNILKGEMSFVGIRPESADFAEKMSKKIPIYPLRYIRKPGLTGHAQISQGYAMDTVEDTMIKLEYDFYYLLNYSIIMDFRIMLATGFNLTKGAR